MTSPIENVLSKNYNQRPVGIVEFCESSEFCGKRLYPHQRVLLKVIWCEELEGWEEDILTSWINGGPDGSVEISPLVRERTQWLRENGYRHFSEVDFVAGRRSSKGYITGACGARKMWEVQQLPDPGRYYEIDPDKEILFACVANSLKQAKELQFSDLISWVTRCKPLVPHLGKVLEEGFSVHTDADRTYSAYLTRTMGKAIGRDFSKLRAQPMAANADTIRGYACMFLVFDEMAFMDVGEAAQTAESCYQAAEPALAQFGTDGMVFCNSSPYQKIGQFYRQVELAQAVNGEGSAAAHPSMLMFKCPSWELYRDYYKDPQERFKTAIMVSPDWDETSMNQQDKAKWQKALDKEKANPEAFRVERRAEWAEVVDAYLSPSSVTRAYQGYVLLEDRTTKIPVTTLNPPTFRHRYKAHLDPSSTTAGFGFAVAHVESFPDERFPGGMAPHVIFDLVKRWDPKDKKRFPQGTIDYTLVQSEVIRYVDAYRPFECTVDQFNAAPLISYLHNEMPKRRIGETRAYEITATKKLNWQRWEVFKTALNLGFVHIPRDCGDIRPGESWNEDSWYSSQELRYLKEENERVTKQDIGPIQTKDVADSLMPGQELLTGRGWVKVEDLTMDDLIATRTPDGILEYQKPTALHQRYTTEPLYEHKSRRLSFSVTPRHNLYGYVGNELTFVQAQAFEGLMHVPKTAIVAGRPERQRFCFTDDPVSHLVHHIRPGECRCGCGGKTVGARRTRTERGQIKGQPLNWLPRHSRRWTSSQDDYLRSGYPDMSMEVMTAVLDKTPQAVYNRARVLQLERGQIGDRLADRPPGLPECSLADFASFIGIWLAEGRKMQGVAGYGVRLTQTKPEGVAWIDALMHRLGWPYVRSERANGEIEWIVKSYQLREYVRKLQAGHELSLPTDALACWGVDALQGLLTGLLVGDGVWDKRRQKFVGFCSSSEQLIDQVQGLLAHVGLCGGKRRTRLAGEETNLGGANWDMWMLSISESTTSPLQSENITTRPYEGWVYCVSVPNHTILLRNEGVVQWIGNCICICTYDLIGRAVLHYMDNLDQGLVTGAQGGYRIGGMSEYGPIAGGPTAIQKFENYYQRGNADFANPSWGIRRSDPRRRRRG